VPTVPPGGQYQLGFVHTWARPAVPTLTRGPHSPALVCTPLEMPTQHHHPSETLINMSSGGSACQRVPCSHMILSTVIRPNSVGSVPSRLLLLTTLKMQHNTTQTTTPHLKWRERVSTGAVISQVRHRRHPSQLGRQRALQAVQPQVAADATQYHSVPLRQHSSCQVEGARVNGCRAFTMLSSPSSVPAP
jgi:hypothetical protein